MKAIIFINYKEGILDPEGVTISKALDNMGINGINELSVGKCIEMNLNETHLHTKSNLELLNNDSKDQQLFKPSNKLNCEPGPHFFCLRNGAFGAEGVVSYLRKTTKSDFLIYETAPLYPTSETISWF